MAEIACAEMLQHTTNNTSLIPDAQIPQCADIIPSPLDFIGAARVTRTPDLRITNAPLYQLSYGGLKGSDDFIEAVICL